MDDGSNFKTKKVLNDLNNSSDCLTSNLKKEREFKMQTLYSKELKQKELKTLNHINMLSNKVDNLSKIIEKQTEIINNIQNK